MIELIVIACLLVCPLVPPIAGAVPARRTAPKPRVLSLVHATAVEAAVARVVTAGAEFSGNTIQLPCRECGRRAIPPADHLDSPPLPAEKSALVPLGSGFVITAICTACSGPLISRVVDAEYAAYARALGVVDGAPLEAEMGEWLATL